MAGAYTAACTSAGCRVLSDVTDAYNSGRPELALAGNKSQELKEKRLVDLDMAPLAVALEENNPFPKLDFSYNLLGVGGAESLRKLVASDGTCTALDLSQNNLNPAASKALFSGLRQNQTLKELRLSGNKLGNLGGMELADLLQKNHALEELHLSNCELDTAALVALATVMRDNRSVRVLDVSRPLAKTLMDEPALHFARMLKVNQTLTDVRNAPAAPAARAWPHAHQATRTPSKPRARGRTGAHEAARAPSRPRTIPAAHHSGRAARLVDVPSLEQPQKTSAVPPARTRLQSLHTCGGGASAAARARSAVWLRLRGWVWLRLRGWV
jgi:hypothetical protein